jgi:3-phenylpropionate/cinnamic acid dioxygenase small subunit
MTDGVSSDRPVRDGVTEVLVRYASGIDRRDWTLFRTCFTDDCKADYGVIGTWHGVEEITEWMARSHEGCGHTLHRITNVAVEPDGDNRVRARCYVDALVMGPDDRGGVRANGFYDDELVRTDDGWRIARRRFTMVHAEPVGQSNRT